MSNAPFANDVMAGRTIFVVGGSGGINLGIARRFIEPGADVAMLSRDEERVAAAAATMDNALGMAANAFRTVVEIDLIGTFNVFRTCFERLRRPGASLIAITAAQVRRAMMFQATARLKSCIPLRDDGTRRDIADMAAFLSSNAAHSVTGTVMDYDGGPILGDVSADTLTARPRKPA